MIDRQTRKLYYRYQPFFVPAGIILLVFVIFVIVLIPFTKQTIALFEDINAVTDQLNLLKAKLSILDKEDEQELTQSLDDLAAAIPVDRSLATILNTIEELGVQSNMTITRITFEGANSLATESGSTQKAEKPDPQYGSFVIPFSVSTEADFSQVRTFLEKTINVRRFIRAQSFLLNFGQDSQLSTQIRFESFYSPLLPSAAASSQLAALTSTERSLIRNIRSIPDFGTLKLSEDQSISIPSTTLRNPFQ